MDPRIALALFLSALPWPVAAQDAPVAAEERTPPRIVRLGALELPDGVGEGLEAIELVVLVDAEGHASVVECAHEAPICELAAEVVQAAELEPARVGGEPRAARIGMRLSLSRPDEAVAEQPESASPESAESGSPEQSESASPGSAESGSPEAVAELPEFSAEAHAIELRGARRFELAEIRDVAGTFGDPFRALDSLPGVTPVASGIPYVYVRGAPPSTSLYLYDDLPLPMLFHFGIGSSIIHPRMLGPVRLHSGVAPARYGRHLGGVLLGEGPVSTGPPARVSGEVEIRLLDANAYMEAPLGGGSSVAVAARYGYPGLLVSLFAPGVDLQYWDYQARADLRIDRRTTAQLVWIGSFDLLSIREQSDGDTTTTIVQFHRAEVRLIRDLGNHAELGLALRGGYDESSISSSDQSSLSVAFSTATIGPRVWAAFREGPVRARVGADLVGSFGRPTLRAPPGPGGSEDLFSGNDSAFSRASARSTGGAFAELVIAPDPTWELTLGGRFDLWTAGRYVTGALDPRARFEVRVAQGLALHAAIGVVRQPASFLVPLPGLSDVPILNGLQTAIQAEAGGRYELGNLEVELQAFAHRYEGLAFVDFFLVSLASSEICERPGGACRPRERAPRTNGTSWGGELFARLSPSHDFPLSGWLSYTLSWNELDATEGLVMRPSYDIRHVLNLVLQWTVVEGFTIGTRLFVRSGAPRGVHYTDMQGHPALLQRELSPFFRIDAQLAYAWDAGWGRMRLSLDVFNATASEEPITLSCQDLDGFGVPSNCSETRTPPIVAPNIGLRVEL